MWVGGEEGCVIDSPPLKPNKNTQHTHTFFLSIRLPSRVRHIEVGQGAVHVDAGGEAGRAPPKHAHHRHSAEAGAVQGGVRRVQSGDGGRQQGVQDGDGDVERGAGGGGRHVGRVRLGA